MTIAIATREDAAEILSLLRLCRASLLAQGIHQWDAEYPSEAHVQGDISLGSLRKLSVAGDIVGVLSCDECQDPEYASVAWQWTQGRIFVIHRLAVGPQFQGAGFAGQLMRYAEQSAAAAGAGAIRLDAYSGNARVLEFYARRDYRQAGEIYFPRRELPFICLERRVSE